ncbi:DUF4136 domain-containing protein [Zymomonas sp.]|uniref:DUF4136 domain-containing protein n=1 Tax=Zymomonas sp. TaxID=2068624 RepID=UPI0025DBD43D|nr:DUF4136 domain-containing protein [Zymomonas sp.]MCA1955805.1 DUF4136 domain-containing protein [Zymomonas sp.]
MRPITLKIAITSLAFLSLSACESPFRANVTRFQMMPSPAGQTFVIQASNPQDKGGLEFEHYADIVAHQLWQQGYQPAAPGAPSTLIVKLDYGIDNGQQKVASTSYGYGGWGGGWGGPWGGWGGWGGYGGWGGGWGGGYGGWGGGWGGGTDVYSYTLYTTFFKMEIDRSNDGQRVFEGRARAQVTTDNMTQLVPDLIQAMFVNFPGHSGEDVEVKLTNDKKKHK